MRFTLGLTIAGAAALICGLMMMLIGEALRLESAHSQGLIQGGEIATICGLACGMAVLVVSLVGPGGRRGAGQGEARGRVPDQKFPPRPGLAPPPQPVAAAPLPPPQAGLIPLPPGNGLIPPPQTGGAPLAHLPSRAAVTPPPPAGPGPAPAALPPHAAAWPGPHYADDGWHPHPDDAWPQQAEQGWSPGPAYVWPQDEADDRDQVGADDWGLHESDGWTPGERADWAPDGWAPDERADWAPGGWAPGEPADWAPDGQGAWADPVRPGRVPPGAGPFGGQEGWTGDGRDDWTDGRDGWAYPVRDEWGQPWPPPGHVPAAWPGDDPWAHGAPGPERVRAPYLAGPEPGDLVGPPGTGHLAGPPGPEHQVGPASAGVGDREDDDTSPLPVILSAADPPRPPAAADPPGPPPNAGRPAADEPAKPFSAREPAAPRGRGTNGSYQPVHAEPPGADTQEKIEQIKDLYVTAEAIGEEALVRHFEQLKTRQRSLIREFFEKAGLGPSSKRGKAPDRGSHAAGESAPDEAPLRP